MKFKTFKVEGSVIPPKRWRGGARIVFGDGRTLNYRVARAERLAGEA